MSESNSNLPSPRSLSKAKLPDSKQSVKLKYYVKLGYRYLVTHRLYLLPTLLVAVAAQLSPTPTLSLQDLRDVARRYPKSSLMPAALSVFSISALYLLLITRPRPRPVYLVDFSCYKPEDALKCSKQEFLEKSRRTGMFTDESLDFQRRVLERSSIGDSTYLPHSINRVPSNPCMAEATKEAEAVMFGAADALFEKTQLNPKDVGILIVNCSLFNPTPSLSAMVVNRYSLRGDIASYNLGGMGCSAGLISLGLAQDLLQAHQNSYALVISTESITLNWYLGNDRSMLVSNCLFRMGGAAVLLSNLRSDKNRSKYKLVHAVRTHTGGDDKCFGCVAQREDREGKVGVCLSKDVMAVAGEALKANITTLGPHVLPMSEQVAFLAAFVGRRLLGMEAVKPYVPDFKVAFEHFCVHAGGRAVLDELEKRLRLTGWHMEPSRMTLYRFGNTSSSSLWYELAYTEAKGRMKKGDRTWQIAFGSGFKCNSAVWKALRTVDPYEDKKNPWMDEINHFPVNVPNVFAI